MRGIICTIIREISALSAYEGERDRAKIRSILKVACGIFASHLPREEGTICGKGRNGSIHKQTQTVVKETTHVISRSIDVLCK